MTKQASQSKRNGCVRAQREFPLRVGESGVQMADL
jgi:hypothetical protein